MTNEELCLLIQQGHDELIPELWEQCRDYVAMMAGKYSEGFPQLDRSVKEDCIQEAYFGFLDAVRLYRNQEASFIHYLSYHLINAFRKACFCGRSKKCLMDPLNNAISLDAQIEGVDGESYTLADLIADDQPELDALVDHDYWQSINGFMHNAFDQSSHDAGKRIYHFMLDHDCGFRDAIVALYGDDAFQNAELMKELKAGRRKTKNDFLKYWNSHKGKEERRKLALDDAIVRNGLRSYGLKRFRMAGSFVESIVINSIDKPDE